MGGGAGAPQLRWEVNTALEFEGGRGMSVDTTITILFQEGKRCAMCLVVAGAWGALFVTVGRNCCLATVVWQLLFVTVVCNCCCCCLQLYALWHRLRLVFILELVVALSFGVGAGDAVVTARG